MKMEQLAERLLRLEKRQEQLNELVKKSVAFSHSEILSALKKIETNQTDILALSQSTTEILEDHAKRIDEIQSQSFKFFSGIQNTAILRYLFRKFDFIKTKKEAPNE